MNVRKALRQAVPHDLIRLYRRWAYPVKMDELRRLYEHVPTSEDDFSLQPFVERQAIFVHIPKCAGISVARELFGCRGGGHLDIHDYRNAFSQRQFRRFYKFTFVRNPWDRLVSAYFFLRDGGLNEIDKARAERSIHRFRDFPDFVEHYIGQEDFATISRRLGLDRTLPRRNAGASRPRDYRSLYTDRAAEVVARAYARDIALFDYSF